MTRSSHIALLALAALLLAAPAFALDEIAPFGLPQVRSSAMGGAHAALADDFFAIFDNPAGFAGVERDLSMSLVNLRMGGPVFDMANLAIGAMSGAGLDLVADLPGLLDENGRLYAELDLGGPVAFGFVGGGLGFGLFNRSALLLNVAGVSSARATIAEDLFLSGGYAHRLSLGGSHLLDLGIQLKGYIRGESTVSGSLLAVSTALMDTGSLMADQPFTLTSGIGADLGLLYSWEAASLRAGFVARDAYSPGRIATYPSANAFLSGTAPTASSGGLIPADLSLGLAWAPGFAFLEALDLAPRIAVDYRDFLDLFAPLPRNPILNLGLGAELRILKILALRAGIADALPNAGFGIDLDAFRFGLSMFGEELGLDPGTRPVFNVLLSFEFRY